MRLGTAKEHQRTPSTRPCYRPPRYVIRVSCRFDCVRTANISFMGETNTIMYPGTEHVVHPDGHPTTPHTFAVGFELTSPIVLAHGVKVVTSAWRSFRSHIRESARGNQSDTAIPSSYLISKKLSTEGNGDLIDQACRPQWCSGSSYEVKSHQTHMSEFP